MHATPHRRRPPNRPRWFTDAGWRPAGGLARALALRAWRDHHLDLPVQQPRVAHTSRLLRCVRFLITVPLGGRQIAKYYGCCDTMFVHPNHLGSTTMITNAAGTVMRDLVFYPYGQTWRNIGNNWDLHFASMWQREFASGLDPTPNRLYHSRLFRWMTPCEFEGRIHGGNPTQKKLDFCGQVC